MRGETQGVRGRRGKRPVTVCEKHGDANTPTGVLLGDDVGVAVAVQIAERHRARTVTGCIVDMVGEGAVAVSEQQRNRVRYLVGGGKVEVAVTVDVSRRNLEPAD